MAKFAKRFTIYDAMEANGAFTSNPANLDSRDSNGMALYKGPQEFPKMLYHPEGKHVVTRQPEAISTPFGPKMVGLQEELIYKSVENAEEEKALRLAGWHSSPAAALRARAEIEGDASLAPPETLAERQKREAATELDKLKRELAELQEKNAELELGLKPKPTAAGK